MKTKQKISTYCKNLRLMSCLNSELFSQKLGVSRSYISKIENGFLDEKHSIAQINKLYKSYGLTFDNLHEMDIDNRFIEGVELLHFTDPYASSKNVELNLSKLKSYLITQGYSHIKNNTNDNSAYDMVGLNKHNNRFICMMIQQFSTGINEEKRKSIILDSILRLMKVVIQNENFDEKQPLEIILFTSSDKTLKVFKDYKESHILNITNTFFQLKVIYLFQNRKPKEITIIKGV